MSNAPQLRDDVLAERQQRAEATGEPLFSAELSIYRTGNSVCVAIPAAAREIHDIDAGDSQRVEVHRAGIWIPADE